MRVISKEYAEHLKNNEIYQFIANHPKPDFTELNRECEKAEKWISKIHEEERNQLREMSKK